MKEFFVALGDPSLPFLLYACLAGLLSSIPFGIVGTFVVTKRISYLAGAIAHCVLGGIGIGLYLQHHWKHPLITPMTGAVVFALLAAFIIGIVRLHFREREDTLIGALWAAGMAIGLIFILKTPGYVEPMSYLFGNILLVTKANLYAILALDLLILAIWICFYNRFVAICFDEEFAKIQGLRSNLYYLILLQLTAITIVTLVNVVGILLVIALLTLPAAIANLLSKRFGIIMLLSVVGCALFNFFGIAISYWADLPSGPVIVLLAVAVYSLMLLIRQARLHSPFKLR